MFALCYWFDQKTGTTFYDLVHLFMILVLLKIEFQHVQISVPKIGIPMLKTACINPRLFSSN